MERALFLDRDGVLNVDRGYTHRVEDLELYPDVSALARIQRAGFRLVVTTNQSGVGRGYFTAAEVDTFHDALSARLAEHGVVIPLSAFFVCPHTPWAGCDCRKPRPGLFLRACRDLSIDATRSYAVGDARRDVEAATVAGISSWLIGRSQVARRAPHVVVDLYDLADRIIGATAPVPEPDP